MQNTIDQHMQQVDAILYESLVCSQKDRDFLFGHLKVIYDTAKAHEAALQSQPEIKKAS